MKKKINEISKLINTKINSVSLNKYTYISTENMLCNFGGVGECSNIPSSNVTSFQTNDILISNIRPYFKKIWFAKFEGGCSNDVLVLRANKTIDSKYLFYALNNENFIKYYVASCKGTKMPRGNKDTLLEWKIDVPILEVQQHIVNTIGSVDDLIENLQAQKNKICNLLEQSLSMFKEKTEIAEYDTEIIKSGIIIFDKYKKYLDTSSIEGINNISYGEAIKYDNRPSRANMQPIKNSVWFAKMKNAFKILIITDKDEDLLNGNILSTGFLGIKASDKLPISLLTSIIISCDFHKQKDLNSVGTTMAGINNEAFLRIQVPLLSEQEMLDYEKKYKSLIYSLSLIRRKIDVLKLLKNTLLKKYF